jgi:hypothetical protein
MMNCTVTRFGIPIGEGKSLMSENDEDKQDSTLGIRTGVRVKPLSSKSVRCNGCKKDFTSEDEYLDHVYDNDKCYNEYLASDRKEMGKE